MNRSEDSSTWTKSKKKRMRRKEAKRLSMTPESGTGDGPGNSIPPDTNSPSKQSTSGSANHLRTDLVNSPIKQLNNSGSTGNISQNKNNQKTIAIQKSTSAAIISHDRNPSFGSRNRDISPQKKDAKIAPDTPTSTHREDKKVMDSTSPSNRQCSAPTENTMTLVENSPNKKKKKKKKKRKKEDKLEDNSNSVSTPKADEVKSKPTSSHQDKKSQADTSNDSAGGKGKPKTPTSPKLQISIPKPSQMSTLQKAFLERLTSSRFRELNEELYTQSSQHSYEQFTKHPELFDQYHVGFRKQVQEWPLNPVDVIYKKITSSWKKGHNSMGENGDREQPMNSNGGQIVRNKIVIADFGCGDAKLAERLLALRIGKDGQSLVQSSGGNNSVNGKASSCPFKVYSFDLVSGGNPLVTPADMSNVPLSNEVLDVAVYSLALMGTNVADFVREAWRVLKFNGVLRVAEVRSRFETAASNGGEDDSRGSRVSGDGGGKRGKLNNGKKHLIKKMNHSQSKHTLDSENSTPKPLMLLDEFMALMERCGFQCNNMDRSNKMFLFMDFVKVDGSKGLSKEETFTAKPCIYKRR